MSRAPARRGDLITVFLTVLIDLLGFGIIIPLLYLFPFWIASRYSITRQIHTEIQSALRVRRGEA